jgi:hypothetical protein
MAEKGQNQAKGREKGKKKEKFGEIPLFGVL